MDQYSIKGRSADRLEIRQFESPSHPCMVISEGLRVTEFKLQSGQRQDTLEAGDLRRDEGLQLWEYVRDPSHM